MQQFVQDLNSHKHKVSSLEQAEDILFPTALQSNLDSKLNALRSNNQGQFSRTANNLLPASSSKQDHLKVSRDAQSAQLPIIGRNQLWDDTFFNDKNEMGQFDQEQQKIQQANQESFLSSKYKKNIMEIDAQKQKFSMQYGPPDDMVQWIGRPESIDLLHETVSTFEGMERQNNTNQKYAKFTDRSRKYKYDDAFEQENGNEEVGQVRDIIKPYMDYHLAEDHKYVVLKPKKQIDQTLASIKKMNDDDAIYLQSVHKNQMRVLQQQRQMINEEADYQRLLFNLQQNMNARLQQHQYNAMFVQRFIPQTQNDHLINRLTGELNDDLQQIEDNVKANDEQTGDELRTNLRLNQLLMNIKTQEQLLHNLQGNKINENIAKIQSQPYKMVMQWLNQKQNNQQNDPIQDFQNKMLNDKSMQQPHYLASLSNKINNNNNNNNNRRSKSVSLINSANNSLRNFNQINLNQNQNLAQQQLSEQKTSPLKEFQKNLYQNRTQAQFPARQQQQQKFYATTQNQKFG